MITKQTILNLIKPKLDNSTIFLVDLEIKPGNKISVEVDKDPSISIEECVEISRQIEHNLDREEEDFELKVSSPGLDKPLRHPLQYKKNIGRKLKVKTNEESFTGKLTEFNDKALTLQWTEKVKIEGKKKKELKTINKIIELTNILEAKVIVSFN